MPMNHDKFNDSISNLLEKGKVSHVIETLRGKCASALGSHPSLANVLSGLDRVANTYYHMREYMLAGASDPSRHEVYRSVIDELKSLGRGYLFIVNEDRLDPFFAEYRLQKMRNISVASLLSDLAKNEFRISMAAETGADSLPFVRKREQLLDTLFRKVWSLPPWVREDHEALEAVFSDYDGSEQAYMLRAQIISALMLGLLKFNDPAKLSLLLKAYEIDNEKIAARALTAIIIVLGRWGRSAISTPALREAISMLEESILTYSRVRDIVMTLIRTRDTDRVCREVSDAFNTAARELTPEMLEKLQREGLTVDDSETGLNPEWEKLMKNKDLEEKMKAINEMQMEGMDVMMQTFSRLKTFPFFQSVANWFIPFSLSHSAVENLFHTFSGEGFNTMADATDMCASDRYSFALGISQMPQERRSMLAMHIGGQLEALRDMIKDRANMKSKPEFATEALVFARDLYRFVKLFPRKRDFYDPFDQPIDFLRLPLLGPLLQGDDIIMSSADFYFYHGYYTQALSLYEEASSFTIPERSIYEKMGYCRQMMGDFASALAEYEKADLFSSDADRSSSWLLKKLAFVNKALGRYGAAADYYERLLERNSDDLKTEFQLGCMLLRGGDFNRGREIISKVHYLDPSNAQADRIYKRLKGHEAFVSDDLRKALELYGDARGEQPPAEYAADLYEEIRLFRPDIDTEKLKIFLDFSN